MDSASPAAFAPEALAEQAAWVRRLAHRLAADPELAEDLAQETLLRALESPPRRATNPRGWLATVLHNLHRQSARREGRRRTRERRSGGAGRAPAADEIVERVATERLVAGAVLRLGEPYRSVLLLRFYEELPPRKIAARLGIPVNTVKTRLRRALQRLREELDERHDGNRQAWLSALLPLIQAPASAGPAAGWGVGTLIMSTKLKLAIFLVLLATIVVVAWPEGSAPSELGASGPAPTPAEPAQPIAAGDPAPSSPVQREPVAAPAEPSGTEVEPEAAAAGSARLLRGRVLDADARPLEGIALQFEGWAFRAGTPQERKMNLRSGPGGWFEIDAAAEPLQGQLSVSETGWTTVMNAVLDTRTPGSLEPVVVAAPKLGFAGQVVDARGTALPNAVVSVEMPKDLRARFPDVLDLSSTVGWADRTDENGRFRLEDVPWMRDARLSVFLQSYEPLEQPLPEQSDESLLLTIEESQRYPDELRGQVLDAQGGFVSDALVSVGDAGTRTDERGEFRLRLGYAVGAERIRAVKPGHLPASLDKPQPEVEGAAGWPEYILLRLPAGSPLAISGRVVDADGEAVEGVLVIPRNGTVFGSVTGGAMQYVEEVLGGSYATSTETDADGAFVIEGLLQDSYDIWAVDRSTLVSAEKAQVPAGTAGLEIRMPAEEFTGTLRGRVMTEGGHAVAGVRVQPHMETWFLEIQSSSYANVISGEGVLTDEEGYFEIPAMPAERVYLNVSGDAVLPLRYDLPEDPLDLHTITVSVRCHFRVDAAPGDPPATRITVVDAREETLPVTRFAGNSTWTSTTVQLDDGKSGVMAVADSARHIVFWREGEEIARLPLILRPGEVKAVAP